MTRKAYVNEAPGNPLPQGAPRETVKVEFAKRLQQAMVRKGWNQSELARRASDHLKEGEIRRDNVSHYIRAVAIPQPAKLAALCKALGVKPDELLPTAPSASKKAPPFDMRQLDNGNVWLRVNQAVTFDQALRVMGILHEGQSTPNNTRVRA